MRNRPPRITFDTITYDYGTIPFGVDGQRAFRCTNTRDAPLIIEIFQSTYGRLVH